MEKKIITISILLIALFISFNTVSAVNINNENDSTNLTLISSGNTTIQHNTSVQNNSSVNQTNNKKNILISGNVIKCSDRKPFSGVTVTAYTLSGKKISSVLTDNKGNYHLSFLSNETVFNVIASYPGHVPSSKIINVKNSSNNTLCGSANFQLGPEPQVTIDAPATQFINEAFNFTISFKNNGDVPGFGPIVQLILPSGINLNSASFLGARISVTNVGVFPGNSTGTLKDPLSGLTVTGTSGYRLYILEYPLGSFTSGQPTAVINVNALLLGNSTLGVPLNITAYPVFRFGANETGKIPIKGNVASDQVTPTVIKLSKTSDAPENETATGRNYPHVYTLTVDVANGQTVSAINLKDILPGNLQYIKILNAAGGTIIQEPSTTVPGGLLWIQFTNITGVLGPDKIITYQLFAPELNSSGGNVLNNITGAFTNATNNASVTGIYNSNNVSSSASYTLTLKSLAIQKGVTDTTSSKPKPTDILNYILNFQVSDYFSIRNMVIRDTLGDGQTFLTGSSYTPYLNLHLPTGSTAKLYFNLSNLNQFQMVHDSTTGITYLMFNITQLLIDNGYTGILQGGNYTGIDYGATQGSMVYWSQIDINYESLHRPIVSADHIDNNVQAEAELVNSGSNVSDTSGTRVVIVASTSQKSIYAIERNGVYLDPKTTTVQPGDHITFSLLVHVPTTNLNGFYIVDYLPIPLFRSGQITLRDTSGNIPPPGYWCLANDDTLSALSGVDPVLVVDTAQNSLSFIYGNVYNSTQIASDAHILFTVTATGDPMADGLFLTNLMNINYNNSFNQTYSDNQIVSLVVQEPVLNITKTVTPSTGRQAGDTVNYTITITNTGNAPAYNVLIKDNLLLANSGYIIPATVSARYANGTIIDLTGLGNLFGEGLNFGSLYPIFGVNDTNNTIIITYAAVLNSTVYPLQVINNTAQITKFTSLPPGNSTNFVTDPSEYQASASVNILGPQFQKTYIGSQGGPSTGSNLTIGETGKYRLAITLPAGQTHDLVIKDIIPAGMTLVNYTLINNPLVILPNFNVSQLGNMVIFSFPGATNTTYGANTTFYIDLLLRVDNNSTTNPLHNTTPKTNNASMDWNDPGHSAILGSSTVNIVEPWLQVTKIFTPNKGSGGQKVTVTLQVKNIGTSTAYNVLITDPLDGSSSIFDLSNVQSYDQNGFIYSFLSNIVTFTGGNITPGQILNFTFNVTVLNDVVIGPMFNNTAYANYYSLLNGTNPDVNGRNYTDSGWATFRAGDPSINKVVVNSSIHGNSGKLVVGEHVTYRITVTAPKGQATNLNIKDILPSGYAYVGYGLNSSTWNGNLGNLVVTSNGQTIFFNFTGTTLSLADGNTFYIDLEAVVLNQSVNQIGNVKTNNVNLTWDENTHGPFSSAVNTTIVGPALSITKTVTPNIVDGSDKINISLRVRNTGTSPAYEINLKDVLNSTLFNPSSFNYTPVPGYTISINGYTVSIIGDAGTFLDYLSNNNTLYFNFTVNAANDVPSNSTFTNQATGIYYSLPSTFSERRGTNVSSNIVNINTISPSVGKSINSTSEHESKGTNVFIGEVVTYRIDLTIPEGKTLNVSLKDILPANLQYNGGTVLIIRSSDNITATGFTFTLPAGQYETYTGSILPLLTFNLGDITYAGAEGLNNGTISIIFNVTVLNILSNQNGTKISNDVTLNYTNATGSPSSSTAQAPDLNVTLPKLSTNITADKTIIQGGDTITYTIIVRNDAGATAPAYDIIVTNSLPAGLVYNGIISLPSGWTIDATDPSNIIFIAPAGFNITPGQNVTIVFQANATQDLPYNTTLSDKVNATGTTLPGLHGTNNATPGDPGTPTGKRTGQDGSGGLNNIIAVSNVNVTSRAPSISKNSGGQKAVNRSIGNSAPETITIILPEGYTNHLQVNDLLPAGLQANNFSFTFSSGILHGIPQYTFNSIDNTWYIDFGQINATQSGTITIDYTVLVLNVPGNVNGVNLVNNAILYYQNGTGTDINAGSDTATVKVIEPNLNITKTASKTNLNPGENVTFTLNIGHTAGSTADAYNLKIKDIIPGGLTYVSGSSVLPVGWMVDESQSASNILIFYTNSSTALLLGQNIRINFTCTAGNFIWAGQNLINNVGLNYTSSYNESLARSYGPVNASATVHVIGADIYVVKTGPASIKAGQQLKYILRIGNNGPDNAVNVTLNDLIDPAWFNWLTNVKYNINGVWYDFTNPLNLLVISSLQPGVSNEILINITGTVKSSTPTGILNNTASVSSATADPVPDNNTSTVLTEIQQEANITVTKTGPNTVTAGNIISYNILVKNNGPSDAQNVRVTDKLPSYVTGLYYSLDNWVTWNSWPVAGIIDLGTLVANTSQQIWINGTVNSATPNGTVLNNTVNVTSPTDPEVPESWTTSTVNTVANLALVKNNNPSGSIIAGNKLSYTITLVNNGPSVARNVVFNDNALSSYLTSRMYRYSINGGMWSDWLSFNGSLTLNVTNSTNFPLGFIDVGENFTVEITGTVNSSTPNGTVLTNYANVTSDTNPQSVVSNTVTNSVETLANLNIVKTAPSTVTAGQNDPIIFTLHISNTGPSDALNVVLTDLVDSSKLSDIEYQWNGSPWIIWAGSLSLGTVTAESEFDILIHGSVLSSALGELNNTANITTSTPNTGNVSSNTTTIIKTLSGLNIIKTAPPTVTAGQTNPLIYTLHISNNGPSDALNVVLTDLVDSSRLSNVEYQWNGSPWIIWAGSLSLGTVTAGSEFDILIHGNVLSSALGQINNTANLTTITENNGNLTSNTTTAVNTLSSLNIIKSAPSNVTAGQSDPIFFTLHVTNNGPSDAQNVVLLDSVDSRLNNLEYRWNGSGWIPWTGSLSLGTVTAGSEFDILIRAIVPDSIIGMINNTAYLTSDTNTTGNLTSNTTTQIDTSANLTLNKTTTPGTITAGKNVIYAIKLTNNGSSAARDLILHDDTLSSYILNRSYRYSINGDTWTDWTSFTGPLNLNISSVLPYGYLSAGDYIIIQINGTLNSSTPNGTIISNYANVTSSTPPGEVISNVVNNTVITEASLEITKVADVKKIVRGHPVHYTITITNNGPSDALNVNFYDYCNPEELLNTYYATSTGIPWTAYTGPLNIENLVSVLSPGSSVIIWVNGTVSQNASQSLINTAVTSSETDSSGNKTAQVTIPLQTSNITIKKTVNNSRPYIHETIYFTLIVQNRGPDTAVSTYVEDKLPPGFRYISSTANYGVYDPDTGIWTIGDLPENTVAKLLIRCVVEKYGLLENHAHVYTASYDPVIDDHSSTVTVNVQKRPGPNLKHDHGKKIPMQKAGIPIQLFVLAILMVVGGFVQGKRN